MKLIQRNMPLLVFEVGGQQGFFALFAVVEGQVAARVEGTITKSSLRYANEFSNQTFTRSDDGLVSGGVTEIYYLAGCKPKE